MSEIRALRASGVAPEPFLKAGMSFASCLQQTQAAQPEAIRRIDTVPLVLAALDSCLSPQAKSANPIITIIHRRILTNNEYRFCNFGWT